MGGSHWGQGNGCGRHRGWNPCDTTYLLNSVILRLRWLSTNSGRVSLNNSSSFTLSLTQFTPSWDFRVSGNDPCTLRSKSPTRAFIFSTFFIMFFSSSQSLSKFSYGR